MVIVSCRSNSTGVPISLNILFEAMFFMDVVVALVFMRLASIFFVFFPLSDIMLPRYLYEFEQQKFLDDKNFWMTKLFG